MKRINFSWCLAFELHARIKALAKSKGISAGAMVNIIVNENIAKYE
jgi:hypothetical protein